MPLAGPDSTMATGLAFADALVAESELVLEVPETCNNPDVPNGVAALVHEAQTPFLGHLAAPCECDWRDDW